MRTVLTNSGPYGAGRSTAQRRVIADAIPDRAFTVAELAETVASLDPTIGLATVYRSVAAMERSGWVTRVGDANGTALYARCHRRDHHHHAVCTSCGKVEHTACPVAEHSGVSAPAGFRVTSHELTLYGLCDACVAPDESRPGEPG